MQAVIKIIQENIPEVRLGVWGLFKLLTNYYDYFFLKCIQLGNIGGSVALRFFTFTIMFREACQRPGVYCFITCFLHLTTVKYKYSNYI